MKRSVYIETTIPSFHCEVRAEPEMAFRRDITRRWWEHERPGFDLCTSFLTLDELGNGEFPGKEDALRLLDGLHILEITGEVKSIANIYVRHQLMPGRDMADALHIALAVYYRVDFLLTWNCRHLANPNKTRHFQVINGEMGYWSPIITTPDLLCAEEST